jgi:hypothetical protein
MPSRTQCNPNPPSDPSSPGPSSCKPDGALRPRRWPIQRSLPSAPPLEGMTPLEIRARSEARIHAAVGLESLRAHLRQEPQRTWDEGPYSLDRARVVMDEMATYLGFVRDRLEDHAYRLPESADREAQIAFEAPYEVATEMWQVAMEVTVHLEELIDRMNAAARVTQPELDAEFEELAEAAGV